MSDRQMTPVEARRAMTAYIESPGVLGHLQHLMPEQMVRRFCAFVATDAMRQPKLAEAIQSAPDTLLDAITACAGSGLMPGTALGQFYLIPRWNGQRGRMEVTWITGYKGLANMLYRHPRVYSVQAQEVVAGEDFAFDPGAGTVRHKYALDAKRDQLDDLVAVYAKVQLTVPNGQRVDGKPIIRVLNKAEILRAKASSEMGRKNAGPWREHPIPMALKTAIRRVGTNGSVPVQPELMELLAREDERDVVRPEPERDRPVGVQGMLGAIEPEAPPISALDMAAQRSELANLCPDIEVGELLDEEVSSRLAQARERP